ncbi:MAG: M28 family peptidase [Chloroflexota bacterium]|nr:M28 family peptidase [Chloroflexota bacterium]
MTGGAIGDAVSTERLMAHNREIARWVRHSGTPEEARAFDYIAGALESFGYAVRRYRHPALVGYPRPGAARLEVLAPERFAIPCNGYSLSPATPAGGVEGELLFVGGGAEADYPSEPAAGKVVISEGLAMPAKARAADRRGALAQIHVNDEHIHEMCISPVWGTPTPETAPLLPRTPAVAVTREGGDRLLALLRGGRGPTRVRVVTEPFLGWVELPLVVADLPGAVEDRFVLFSGHVDSWHYGAMDNGSVNATQLEVAQLLAGRRGELRRGVRLAFWSGHSHGRYAGSCWYADGHWADLHERCACHVNIDSVGAVGATVLEEAPTMAETWGFARGLLRELAGVELDYRRISRSSDQSFWGHGVPSLFGSLSEQARDDSPTGAALAQLLGGGGRGGGLGWWWHTTEDTLDKIDPDNLRRDARVYAEALWRLCTVERLPFDYAAVADEFAAALDRHGEAARGALDLSGTAALARDLGARLRGIDLDRLDPDVANGLVMALGRALIPVGYTRSGPFEHDLALGVDALPGLSDAGRLGALDRASADFRYLQTRLVRERNRVEHALRAALALVDAAGVAG